MVAGSAATVVASRVLTGSLRLVVAAARVVVARSGLVVGGLAGGGPRLAVHTPVMLSGVGLTGAAVTVSMSVGAREVVAAGRTLFLFPHDVEGRSEAAWGMDDDLKSKGDAKLFYQRRTTERDSRKARRGKGSVPIPDEAGSSCEHPVPSSGNHPVPSAALRKHNEAAEGRGLTANA